MTEDRFEPGPDYIPFWQVSTSRIGRWVIDLKTGTATSERLGDRPVELPKIDDRFIGQSYRWGFMVADERFKAGLRINSIVRRDAPTGKGDRYTVNADNTSGASHRGF